jgi:hypothetical protein
MWNLGAQRYFFPTWIYSIIVIPAIFIFILTLLLPAGQAGEVGKSLKKAMFIQISGSTGQKYVYTFVGAFAKFRTAVFSSSCLFSCPPFYLCVQMEQLGSHWTDFCDI